MHPCRAAAADIIKRAMIDMHAWLQTDTGLDIDMIMQVHDELVFEIAETGCGGGAAANYGDHG